VDEADPKPVSKSLMLTQAGTAAGPAVGANCRRGEQTYAMGRLKFGAGCASEDPEERR
jgi:hypothetical protein